MIKFEEESAKIDRGQYKKLVRKLIDLTHIRPHLAYATIVVSKFIHDSRVWQMQVVDCALQYLKVTLGRGPLFKRGGSLTTVTYTDADYQWRIQDPSPGVADYLVFF